MIVFLPTHKEPHVPHHPSIAIISLSGTLPGPAVVLATHEDTGETLAFRLRVAPGATPEAPWTATAEASGLEGQGSSHLGPYEAALRAMQDALAG